MPGAAAPDRHCTKEGELEKLTGVIPALYTIYDGDGNISTDGLGELVAFVLDRGCSGLFVGGTTVEGFLQSIQERKDYIQAVVTTVAHQVPVIAHVGGVSTRDACELARFSAQAGADAVGAILPTSYPLGASGAVRYLRAIAQAAELPLIIYYLERVAATRLDPRAFAENFCRLPHLLGLKYTSPDLEVFRQIIECTGGELNMLIGCDQVFLPALVMGADGAIGTTYNFMPELFVEMYAAFRRGETAKAQSLMFRAFRVIRLLLDEYPVLDAGRHILRLRGIETGPCRAPIPPLAEGQKEQLERDLRKLDFFTDPIR